MCGEATRRLGQRGQVSNDQMQVSRVETLDIKHVHWSPLSLQFVYLYYSSWLQVLLELNWLSIHFDMDNVIRHAGPALLVSFKKTIYICKGIFAEENAILDTSLIE